MCLQAAKANSFCISVVSFDRTASALKHWDDADSSAESRQELNLEGKGRGSVNMTTGHQG